MIKLDDEIIVDIEKMSYGKMGLARYGKDNFVIFVENSVPNDKLKVKIISINKKFAKAKIIEIINPSSFRTKPFCALYNACGSCDMQHIDYKFLIKEKQNTLKDIFKNVIDEQFILPVIQSPQNKEYRHKIQYPARQTKNSKRILLGYFKENSHDITNIKFCPIQPDIINKIAQFIRDNFPLDCYFEKKHKGYLRHVLTRINEEKNEVLITFVLNMSDNQFLKNKNLLEEFAFKLKKEYPIIKGIFVNLNCEKSNKILSNDTIKIVGDDYIVETLKKEDYQKQYKIGPASFFQVNPKGATELFEIVRNNIKPNSTVLDAYGGVGAIGIWVGDKASKITLVEENENAVQMAKENFALNKIENFEIFKGDAKKHFIDFKRQNKQFDYIILDPPRSGCDKEGLLSIVELAKNIIYVSCNPQTQRRDTSLLIENGFKPKFVQGVDLFPYTHHIESVILFEKEN